MMGWKTQISVYCRKRKRRRKEQEQRQECEWTARLNVPLHSHFVPWAHSCGRCRAEPQQLSGSALSGYTASGTGTGARWRVFRVFVLGGWAQRLLRPDRASAVFLASEQRDEAEGVEQSGTGDQTEHTTGPSLTEAVAPLTMERVEASAAATLSTETATIPRVKWEIHREIWNKKVQKNLGKSQNS